MPGFVIDIGSNKGQSIDFFLSLNSHCKILAFEPNPVLFRNLKKKYKLNSNIQIFNLGISNVNDEKPFYETILNTTSSFEKLDYSSNYVKRKAKFLRISPTSIVSKTYNVEATTLSNFIINSEIKEDIDIIKIDTEGHEYACLVGLFSQEIRNKIRFIQIENHSNSQYSNKVDFSKINNLLEKNKFKALVKIPHLYGDFSDYIYSKL